MVSVSQLLCDCFIGEKVFSHAAAGSISAGYFFPSWLRRFPLFGCRVFAEKKRQLQIFSTATAVLFSSSAVWCWRCGGGVESLHHSGQIVWCRRGILAEWSGVESWSLVLAGLLWWCIGGCGAGDGGDFVVVHFGWCKMQRVGAGVRMAWSSRAAMRERGMYQRMRIDEDDKDDHETSTRDETRRRIGVRPESPVRASLQKWLHRALEVVPVFSAAPVVPLSESPKRELRMQRSAGKGSGRSKKHHQDKLYFPRRWC